MSTQYFGLVLTGRRLQWGRIGPSTTGHRFFSRMNVWRRPGERYSDAAVIQIDRGGISARFRTGLIVVPGNLTGIRYRDEILDPVAVPFVRRHNLVLQQDSAVSLACFLT